MQIGLNPPLVQTAAAEEQAIVLLANKNKCAIDVECHVDAAVVSRSKEVALFAKCL